MISFIIPAYNEAQLIERCIVSIQMACPTKHEIIVVDNGSTDDTRGIAERAGAHVYYEKEKGVTRARNAGVAAAQYDLIAFIDADCVMPVGWWPWALLELMDPRVVAASGPVIYTEMKLASRVLTSSYFTIAYLLSGFLPVAMASNIVIKRSAINQIGGWNEAITFYGDDTDMAKRLSKVGRVNFSLDMWVATSARRMNSEGLLTTGARYVLNFIWVHAFGQPWSTKHNDVRPGQT